METAVQHLFELPKFEVQKEFCRMMVEQYNPNQLFGYVISKWEGIPTNRRDKFFYLLNLLLPQIEYDIFTIEDVDLRNYCLKNKFVLDEKTIFSIANCKHKSTLNIIREMVYPVDENLRNLAFSLGKDKKVKKENREILYQIYLLDKKTAL